MKKHSEAVALAAILLLALGLRAWGIGWGMPYAFHPDEDNYLPGAMGMLLKGDLNPHYFSNPPLVTYAVLAELFAYLKAGQLLGFPQTPMDVGLQLLVAPTPLYAMARMNSALAGTATVLMTYLVGRKLLGTWPSLAGALLLAVAFLPVRDSHYAVNDIPATFLLMASFLFATRIPSGTVGKGLVPYLLSGLLLGLGVAFNGQEGLETARQRLPDLIVLDVMMEEVTEGFDLSREFRADPSLGHVPIIMLTSVNRQFRPLTFGPDPTWLPVDRFLDKPLPPQRLLAEIESILEK